MKRLRVELLRPLQRFYVFIFQHFNALTLPMFAAIDSWLFLLLIAMAGLLRLLASKAGTSQKSSESPGPPRSTQPTSRPSPPRSAPQSDEEQIRRFLEALGQAPGSKPPPPVVPRQDVAPRPLAPVQPPRTFLPTPVPTKKRTVIAPQPSEEWLRKINRPGQPIASAPTTAAIPPTAPEPEAYEFRQEPAVPSPQPKTPAEAYAIATGKTVIHDQAADLVTLLATPAGLRHAVILREIFGPPRGLQPLSEIAAF